MFRLLVADSATARDSLLGFPEAPTIPGSPQTTPPRLRTEAVDELLHVFGFEARLVKGPVWGFLQNDSSPRVKRRHRVAGELHRTNLSDAAGRRDRRGLFVGYRPSLDGPGDVMASLRRRNIACTSSKPSDAARPYLSLREGEKGLSRLTRNSSTRSSSAAQRAGIEA